MPPVIVCGPEDVPVDVPPFAVSRPLTTVATTKSKESTITTLSSKLFALLFVTV